MPTYAIANLSNVNLGEDIVRYIERIDATLVPFEGRFLVHGVQPEVLEGPWADTTVVIVFPDREHALGWYRSPAYQAILPLRTENSDSAAILVEGVSEDYRAADFVRGIDLSVS